MTFELIPSERVTIEVIHLLNIHTAVWKVILTHVTVAALKPNQGAILSQMFAHFVISRFEITTAFEKVTLTLATFSMTLKILNSVTIDFPILCAPVSNFNSVDGVLENLRLNWAIRIWVITFAKAAHNSVFLSRLLTLILQKAGIADDLRTVSTLFRVNWNV